MSILKYPGSKQRIAPWIISHFSPHHSYLEPYFGGGAVLLNKVPSRIETVNDLDGDVVNLFRILRHDPEPLARAVALTPYSRAEYDGVFCQSVACDEIERARRFLIQCWMGHGFRTCEKSGWKNDVAGREAAYAVRNWYRLPYWMEQIVNRLREVQIENLPAVDVIRRFNRESVLIYADPPYLLSTRRCKQYRCEMTDADHIELLDTLLQHKGQVVLSGYDNAIYDSYLKGWAKHQTETTAEKGLARTETIWVKPMGEIV